MPSSTSERSARPRGPFALGVDIGGTKVLAVLVDGRGKIVAHGGHRIHANDGVDGVLGVVREAIEACLGNEPPPVAGLGVGLAGQVDRRRGTVHLLPNLGWRDLPLARRLTREFGYPTCLVNDAQAGAYAEWRHRSSPRPRDLFLLTLGTGVGGAAIVDGTLREGAHGSLGEVGHTTIVSGGRLCHCGNRGCVEAYVGGWAIADRARSAALESPAAARRLMARAGSPEKVTARTVLESYRAGHRFARSIVDETLGYLADVGVNLANAFNPEVLVLAGGLARALPGADRVLEAAIRSRALPPASRTRVEFAAFGEDAVALG
ncbi:MAG: ROK family protein, partial [Thermoplasmata archaeon]